MAIRKHRAGELVIEQTRDLALVRQMLMRANLTTDGIEWPAACYLAAYFGDQVVGVIGVDATTRDRCGSARGGAQGSPHARRAPSLLFQYGCRRVLRAAWLRNGAGC